MQGRLDYAIISFCADLTDPNGMSRPVAMIGLMSGSNTTVLFQGAIPDLGETELVDDEFSRHILNDLPRLLNGLVEDGLAHVDEDELLFWIHENLRNSLHVSEISRGTETITVSGPQDFVSPFVQIFAEKVLAELHSVLIPKIQVAPLPTLEARSASRYAYAGF